MLLVLVVLAAAPAAAEKAASVATNSEPSKQIVLARDIIPTWRQLGTKKKTKKIRLTRVFRYWDKLRSRDKRAVKTLYSTKKEDKKAMALVDDFYNDAEKCLHKQRKIRRQNRKKIEAALRAVKACIDKTATVPTYWIPVSQNLPNEYFMEIVAQNDKEEEEDEKEDAEEEEEEEEDVPTDTSVPTITEMPTEPDEPGYTPTTETPVEPTEPIEPMTETPGGEPIGQVQEIDPNITPIIDPVYIEEHPHASDYPLSPASRAVPPLWALDYDHSGAVDLNEWQSYVSRLHAIATEMSAEGRDEQAVALLKTIVNFHYSSLSQCIFSILKAHGVVNLVTPEYEVLAQTVEDTCNVKFRYSIFAGAPAFEWVAKDQPTVTAAEIETWFAKRVKQAHHDLEMKQIVSLTHEEKEVLKRLVSCTFAVLKSAGETPIHREAFYAGVAKVEQCARE